MNLPLIAAASPPAAPQTPSENEIVRAVVLLLDGLIDDDQFKALVNLGQQELAQLLADPEKRAAVTRARLEIQNSGAGARLEAVRHARAAVEVAAQIMADTDMHPSHRISAATFIARAAGTEKASTAEDKNAETFTVNIIMGPNPEDRVTIEATPIRHGASAHEE